MLWQIRRVWRVK